MQGIMGNRRERERWSEAGEESQAQINLLCLVS